VFNVRKKFTLIEMLPNIAGDMEGGIRDDPQGSFEQFIL
jgi:hypothetical protein